MAFERKRPARGNLGRSIRSIRRRLDVNQTEFARILGWPRWLICKYELDRLQPGSARLIRLLKFAEGGERPPIIAALAARGVLASDLSDSLCSRMAPVSGHPSEQTDSESPDFLDGSAKAAS